MGDCFQLNGARILILDFFAFFERVKVQFSRFLAIFDQKLTFGPLKKTKNIKNQNSGFIKLETLTHSLCIWIFRPPTALGLDFYSFLVISSWKKAFFLIYRNFPIYLIYLPTLKGSNLAKFVFQKLIDTILERGKIGD